MVSLIAMTGCCYTQFNVTRPDGTKVGITNSRFLWTTDGYNASLGTNGAVINVSKSGSDNATITAVAQGVAQGVIQGAK